MSKIESAKNTTVSAEDTHRAFMRTLKTEPLINLDALVRNYAVDFTLVFDDSPIAEDDVVNVIVHNHDAFVTVACNKQILLQTELFKSLLDEGVDKSDIDLTSRGTLGTVSRHFSLREWYCMYQLLVLYKHVEYPPDQRLNRKATNDHKIVAFIDKVTRTFGRELLGTLALQCQFIGCQKVLYDLATKMALTSKNMSYEEYLEYWEIPVESVDKICDEALVEKVDPKTGEVTREPSMASMERKIRRGLQTDVLFCDRNIDEKIPMRVLPPDFSHLHVQVTAADAAIDPPPVEEAESSHAEESENASESHSDTEPDDGEDDGEDDGHEAIYETVITHAS